MLELLFLACVVLLIVVVQLLARISNDMKGLVLALRAQSAAAEGAAAAQRAALAANPPNNQGGELRRSRGVRCPGCSEEVPATVNECPHCGTIRAEAWAAIT